MRLRTHPRRFAAALVISALLAATPAILPASPAAARTREIRTSFCPIDWHKGPRQVKRMIRCTVRRWHVPGGARKAIHIARRESGLRPRAYNSGGYAGLFQQSVNYWPRRAKRYGFPGRSPFNGRANIVVSIRMVRSAGWSPWSTA